MSRITMPAAALALALGVAAPAGATGTQPSGSGGGAGTTHSDACCIDAPRGAGTGQVRSRADQFGVVTAIDNAGKTFTCHWRTSDWTYRTDDRTVFRMGRGAGSWSDLKVGETVQVDSHVETNGQVADLVTISAS
jgi:hypothetical protein